MFFIIFGFIILVVLGLLAQAVTTMWFWIAIIAIAALVVFYKLRVRAKYYRLIEKGL